MEFGRNVMEGKVIPVQARTDPESSRRLRLPNFKTFSTIKVARFKLLDPTKKYSWYSFLLETVFTPKS
jgi:hypothetical protein